MNIQFDNKESGLRLRVKLDKKSSLEVCKSACLILDKINKLCNFDIDTDKEITE